VKPEVGRHPTSLDAPGRWRRRPLALTVPLVVVLTLVTWLLAFGLVRNPDRYRNPLVGHAAPAFALSTLDGRHTVRLSQFRGQVVVMNFWASWCTDCTLEHGALQEAWQRYRDQGVVVLGVAYQDAASNAQRYVRELGGGWPVVMDAGSRTGIAYGVRGVPETFFISRDGRVAAHRDGPVTYQLLSEEISRLLGRSV
jgi:cytochrome c biogenesis protein CcmG, thiol:disulfide interchange protein DsbE